MQLRAPSAVPSSQLRQQGSFNTEPSSSRVTFAYSNRKVFLGDGSIYGYRENNSIWVGPQPTNIEDCAADTGRGCGFVTTGFFTGAKPYLHIAKVHLYHGLDFPAPLFSIATDTSSPPLYCQKNFSASFSSWDTGSNPAPLYCPDRQNDSLQ